MIHLARLFVVLIISLISGSTVFSQQHTNSIWIVHEALKIIRFSEPEFETPFATKMTQKGIAIWVLNNRTHRKMIPTNEIWYTNLCSIR